jgi:MFS family permease
LSSSPGAQDRPSAPPEEREEALPSAAAPGRPSYTRTLRNRPFFLVWLAQLISQSGDYIFDVALLWFVLQETHSAFAVAVVVTGAILPSVLLGPFLGVYVDRWDRRKTLVATNIGQGVVVAALSVVVALGHASLPVVFVVVLLLGVGFTIVRAATSAYVPSVVPPDDLPPANGLLSLSGSLNQVVGLGIGGAFVALLGVTLPIEYDAISFFAAAVLLVLIPRIRPTAASAPVAPTTFREEFVEGFAFIRKNRFLLEIIAIGVLVNFFGNGLSALFAPYTQFVLHAGVVVYGLLGAILAVGSLVGAGIMGKVNMHTTAGKYLFAGGITLGPLLLALGLTTSIPVAFVVMALFGVALAVTNLPISVAMQAKIPGRLLGRVSATFGALVTATSPAGPLFAGWFAQTWSVAAFFVLSGIVMTVVIGVGALTMRSLRTLQY